MCRRPNTPKSNSKALGELVKPLRDRLWTAAKHSPRGGAGLALVSGHRDPGSQWDLRHARVPHGQECNSRYSGYPVTAVPPRWNPATGQYDIGGSKHCKRMAADMGGYDLTWLVRNHRAFGLARTVPSESWHYEVGGDPDVDIIEYPGWTYDGPSVTPLPEDFFEVNDKRAEELFKDLRERLNEVKAVALRADTRSLRTVEILEGKPDNRGPRGAMRPSGAATGTLLGRTRDAVTRIEAALEK